MIWIRLPTCRLTARRVEADIGRDDPAGGRRVQFVRMGDLVDIAARLQGLEEFRLEGRGGGHGSTL
jgi:hypothetical protein